MLPKSGSLGLNPSDTVAQPLVDNGAGYGLPSGNFGIALGKSLKPAIRGDSWTIFHTGMLGVLCSAFQSNVSRGVPLLFVPRLRPLRAGRCGARGNGNL